MSRSGSFLQEVHFLRPLLDQQKLSRRSVLNMAGLALAEGALTPLLTACDPATSNAPVSPTASPSVGATILTYHNHNSGVYTVTWSPNGKRIASWREDYTVQIWQAR